MEHRIFPTWGYKADGSAQIFDLKAGEDLPEGWSARMELWNHPNTRNLHSRPAEPITEEPKKRGRPRKNHDEEPGAELASELRDE